ncbi:hypothetical protein MXB_1539 [Myxobolus squamalis]|nr:hypothetical protein MXB_1539 [Myxobolus squamalis]
MFFCQLQIVKTSTSLFQKNLGIL